jgi:hypothetical protein
VHFTLDQQFAAPPAAVAAAFASAELYELVGALPDLGTPEVLSREVDGDVVHLRVHYRFERELSSVVRRVIDPKKLTWVEDSTHDLAARRVDFRLEPDYYADRLRCSGTYRFAPSGDGTARHVEGDLSVRAPLVAGRVEQAIVAGLRDHLDAEVALVESFIEENAR